MSYSSRYDSNTPKMTDGMKSGPLVVFDSDANTILVAPFDNFMSISMWHDGAPGGTINWGVMGGVDYIPKDYSVKIVAIAATGIKKVGDRLWRCYRPFWLYSNQIVLKGWCKVYCILDSLLFYMKLWLFHSFVNTLNFKISKDNDDNCTCKHSFLQHKWKHKEKFNYDKKKPKMINVLITFFSINTEINQRIKLWKIIKRVAENNFYFLRRRSKLLSIKLD